jgi:hypothetical protein
MWKSNVVAKTDLLEQTLELKKPRSAGLFLCAEFSWAITLNPLPVLVPLPVAMLVFLKKISFHPLEKFKCAI